MDDDNKSMRNQREAASWNSSTLTVPAIILAVILLMVGSTIMSKMTPPAASPSPSPSAAPATFPAAGEAAMRQMRGKVQKMSDPAFMTKYREKAKSLKGDFTKLSPADQKELDEATQGHGQQFFEMTASHKP